MEESPQEMKYEVQQSGDKIPPTLDNGCNTDSTQTDQNAITTANSEAELIELHSEKSTESTEPAVTLKPESDIPILECQTPAASQVQVDDAPLAPPSVPVIESDAIPTLATAETATTCVSNKPKDSKVTAPEKKREDDKLGIYKALAIKLKKELVKTRDELAKLKDQYKSEVSKLREQATTLEITLESERIASTNTNATLEATVKNLRNQLEAAERDMQSLQIEFENYKTRATKILQQNQPVQSSSSRFCFEEELYKQLKSLSEEQKGQIKDLSVKLDTITGRNKELEYEFSSLSQQLGETSAKVEQYQSIEEDRDRLILENEALRLALEQYKTKGARGQCKTEKTKRNKTNKIPLKLYCGGEPSLSTVQSSEPSMHQSQDGLNNETKQSTKTIDPPDSQAPQVSPSGSFKDDNQTNSSSSFDSSAYGYVHIKPTPFEIISRSSVLEDAQNQIDNLTKAYLDSESTNSLLVEQVRALKEEIRRIQRGNERMELANNLEYLKNVVFKFVSLDQSQVEQKQRLIPVISTILKLSPEETSKLNSLALVERPSMTSSFFKL